MRELRIQEALYSIDSDLKRYGIGSRIGLLKCLLFPGFRYVFFFRLASIYKKKNILGVMFRLILRHYSYKYGIQIPACTEIGSGLYIGHFGNIIVSSGATIGNNCNLSPGVTIGKVSHGEKYGYPSIGDQVWIGTNSVVVGSIKIGSNVVIAPNSFVNFDVPDNSLVISNRCRIIERVNPTLGLINNLI
jgi:serine O-acetyltransferase